MSVWICYDFKHQNKNSWSFVSCNSPNNSAKFGLLSHQHGTKYFHLSLFYTVLHATHKPLLLTLFVFFITCVDPDGQAKFFVKRWQYSMDLVCLFVLKKRKKCMLINCSDLIWKPVPQLFIRPKAAMQHIIKQVNFVGSKTHISARAD